MKKRSSKKSANLTAKPRNNPEETNLIKMLNSEKFINVVGTWIAIIVIIFLATSCQPLQILPGLCYTDKTGTYLCPKECNDDDKTYHGHCITPAALVNNPEGLRATSQDIKASLICIEELDHGILVDVCKGVVLVPLQDYK